MKLRPLTPAVYTLLTLLFSFGFSQTQDFQSKEIADRVFSVQDTVTDDLQLVIASEKGLVVLNSFWSVTTAQRFKAAISEALKCDDFACVIDMTERLDEFGGNAAYNGIPIIGHKALLDEYQGKEEEVRAEISRLIAMWRHKADLSRQRLPGYEPGSADAVVEQHWLTTCERRADELETGFSLVLPTETYEDRTTLDLGDLTLNLIWFGRAGYNGITVAVIPELKLAIIPGFVLHSQHLAPYPQAQFARLDVPRWIEVLEEILEGDKAVDRVLCGTGFDDSWSRERARAHLHYIRELWKAVAKAESEGKGLPEIYAQLSLENEFAFVKEMQTYKDSGDDWLRPQHDIHIRLFFLQHKRPASEMFEGAGLDSVAVVVDRIRKLKNEGSNVYIEEASLNGIGYYLLGRERYDDAVEVLRLNVDMFPESSNAYDSYAEALMSRGDIQEALLNYNKSLELNPENDNARQMIERLMKM